MNRPSQPIKCYNMVLYFKITRNKRTHAQKRAQTYLKKLVEYLLIWNTKVKDTIIWTKIKFNMVKVQCTYKTPIHEYKEYSKTILKNTYSMLDINLKVKVNNIWIWMNFNHSQNLKNSIIDTSYNKSVPTLGLTQTNGELTSTSASPLAKSLMTNNDINQPPKSNGVHSLGNELPQGHWSPFKNTVI